MFQPLCCNKCCVCNTHTGTEVCVCVCLCVRVRKVVCACHDDLWGSGSIAVLVLIHGTLWM